MGSPTNIADEMHKQITADCFPLKNFKKRSTDDPWIDEPTRKKIKHRLSVFSCEKCCSRNWKELKKITDNMIRTRKARYFEKEAEKLATEGSHRISYKALRDLCVNERPTQWTAESLKPGTPTEQLLEELADHFGTISNEFKPLNMGRIRPLRNITAQDVIDRLCGMKKPKSAVTIDPLPWFVNSHAIHFTAPLASIINQVRNGQPWPSLWTDEEVTIIPRVAVDIVLTRAETSHALQSFLSFAKHICWTCCRKRFLSAHHNMAANEGEGLNIYSVK